MKSSKKVLSFIMANALVFTIHFFKQGNDASKIYNSYYENGITYYPYSKGMVKILDEGVIVDSDGIIIYDQRNGIDANMKIIDSYKIKDINEMKEIINILKEYDNLDKSSTWNRSEESMLREWLIHNASYENNIYTDSTKDVDLNNKDEVIVHIRK